MIELIIAILGAGIFIWVGVAILGHLLAKKR